MKFFITGIHGQLGYDVDLELRNRGYNDIMAPLRQDVDITSKESVERAIIDFKPDVVFHCAAYTAVDKAEDDKENCYNINVIGTKNIVEAAKEVGAKVVYISTDYVFDGTKEGYYKEDDKTNPINYYGETKYLGEEEVRRILFFIQENLYQRKSHKLMMEIKKRIKIKKKLLLYLKVKKKKIYYHMF